MSFVNVLPREKQIEVIAALCEGVGIRTASRLTGQPWHRRPEAENITPDRPARRVFLYSKEPLAW
jgi:hypothetical protein